MDEPFMDYPLLIYRNMSELLQKMGRCMQAHSAIIDAVFEAIQRPPELRYLYSEMVAENIAFVHFRSHELDQLYARSVSLATTHAVLQQSTTHKFIATESYLRQTKYLCMNTNESIVAIHLFSIHILLSCSALPLITSCRHSSLVIFVARPFKMSTANAGMNPVVYSVESPVLVLVNGTKYHAIPP